MTFQNSQVSKKLNYLVLTVRKCVRVCLKGMLVKCSASLLLNSINPVISASMEWNEEY